jgi:phospholipid transport system substrate-binding protein
MTATRWVRVLLAAAVVATAAGGRAADDGPTAVVTRLNDVLVGVLRDADRLGYDGRAKRLAPAVTAAYDVSFMAEKSLGQGWKALPETDRTRWIELSREFSVANYAANFDHDGGQTIELLGQEPAANDTAIVRTRIVDPHGEPVPMSYRLHRTADGWKIIDVYLKGTVSELALRRADYASVLERDGFSALVAAMRTRIDDLAAGRGRRQGA